MDLASAGGVKGGAVEVDAIPRVDLSGGNHLGDLAELVEEGIVVVEAIRHTHPFYGGVGPVVWASGDAGEVLLKDYLKSAFARVVTTKTVVCSDLMTVVRADDSLRSGDWWAVSYLRPPFFQDVEVLETGAGVEQELYLSSSAKKLLARNFR